MSEWAVLDSGVGMGGYFADEDAMADADDMRMVMSQSGALLHGGMAASLTGGDRAKVQRLYDKSKKALELLREGRAMSTGQAAKFRTRADGVLRLIGNRLNHAGSETAQDRASTPVVGSSNDAYGSAIGKRYAVYSAVTRQTFEDERAGLFIDGIDGFTIERDDARHVLYQPDKGAIAFHAFGMRYASSDESGTQLADSADAFRSAYGVAGVPIVAIRERGVREGSNGTVSAVEGNAEEIKRAMLGMKKLADAQTPPLRFFGYMRGTSRGYEFFIPVRDEYDENGSPVQSQQRRAARIFRTAFRASEEPAKVSLF